MDREEALALLDLTDGSDSELIKKLRATLKERIEPAEPAAPALSSEEQEELAGFRRNALFDEAGIPNTREGKLLRRALSAQEGLTVDQIKAEAAEYGITGDPEPTIPAGEAAALDAIEGAAGEAPAELPDLEAKMANAQSPAELNSLMQEAGLTVIGETLQDYTLNP